MPGQELYRRVILPGDVGEPGAVRQGCPFAPRCWMAAQVCRDERPDLRETRPGHWAACHFAGEVEAPASHVGQARDGQREVDRS
jgi:oligopeptide/dipeptide ABC transporter ATP-binding protein